jgi:hypothetical protein
MTTITPEGSWRSPLAVSRRIRHFRKTCLSASCKSHYGFKRDVGLDAQGADRAWDRSTRAISSGVRGAVSARPEIPFRVRLECRREVR